MILEVWMQNHWIKQLIVLMKLFCIKTDKYNKKNPKFNLWFLKGLLEAILHFLFYLWTNHHCTKQHRWSVPLDSHQRGHHEASDVIQKQSETCLSLFVPSIVLHRVIFKGLSSLQKKTQGNRKTHLVDDVSKICFITVDWFTNSLFSDYLHVTLKLLLHAALFASLRHKKKLGFAKR